MRPEIKKKVQAILDGWPALAQHINKEALDEPFRNPKMEKLLRDILDEGIVLLKNKNHALPLSETEEVAYFGINFFDHFYVGYGSGGDVLANYLLSPYDAILERRNALYNKDLMKKYKEYSDAHRPEKGVWGYWSTYYDEMPITREEIEETRASSKRAVVFIGRASGEGQDNLLEPDQYYLNAEEKELIQNVIEVYGRTTLVVNTGNIIDFSWIHSLGDKIDAIVFEWHGGMEAGHAILDVLYGDVNPSGRLTDTVAYEYSQYPSQNFGNEEANIYSEDIYVGYRYFETFAQKDVLYPFGFGLSYTEFTLNTEFKGTRDGIEILATVRNTGSTAGREVVQVYVSKPNGALGNPARELVGFEKTRLLAPKEEETLSIFVALKDLGSYDDSGVTGHKSAWVLLEGEYSFYTGTNVRNARKSGSFYSDKLLVLEQLREACSPQLQFDRMKREGESTLTYEKTPKRTICRREDILRNLPEPITAEALDISFAEVQRNPALMDAFIKSLSIEDKVALCYGAGPMRVPFGIGGNAGMFGGTTEELRRRGVPPVVTTDGPSGLRSSYHASLFPCGTVLACTWNKRLAYAFGDAFGGEIEGKTNMILAPGLNIHRNMLCGRNFEYYSEDPYISFVFAGKTIQGIEKHGMSSCPKHFACNNQELRRNYADSIVSERALREIYLKAFEGIVKEYQPKSIMTSYNRMNGVWSHYNSELVTNILRKEWGFQGVVITDWWMQSSKDPDFPEICDNAYRVRSGIDVLMPGSVGNRRTDKDTTLLDAYQAGDITLGEIERCCREVLSFILTIEI